jgi:hypothetical protein
MSNICWAKTNIFFYALASRPKRPAQFAQNWTLRWLLGKAVDSRAHLILYIHWYKTQSPDVLGRLLGIRHISHISICM